jgi:hypothetical protein
MFVIFLSIFFEPQSREEHKGYFLLFFPDQKGCSGKTQALTGCYCLNLTGGVSSLFFAVFILIQWETKGSGLHS